MTRQEAGAASLSRTATSVSTKAGRAASWPIRWTVMHCDGCVTVTGDGKASGLQILADCPTTAPLTMRFAGRTLALR